MGLERASRDDRCRVLVALVKKVLGHLKKVSEELAMYEFPLRPKIAERRVGSERLKHSAELSREGSPDSRLFS